MFIHWLVTMCAWSPRKSPHKSETLFRNQGDNFNKKSSMEYQPRESDAGHISVVMGWYDVLITKPILPVGLGAQNQLFFCSEML